MHSLFNVHYIGFITLFSLHYLHYIAFITLHSLCSIYYVAFITNKNEIKTKQNKCRPRKRFPIHKLVNMMCLSYLYNELQNFIYEHKYYICRRELLFCLVWFDFWWIPLICWELLRLAFQSCSNYLWRSFRRRKHVCCGSEKSSTNIFLRVKKKSSREVNTGHDSL